MGSPLSCALYRSICRRPAVSGLSRHPAPFCAVEAQHERWRGVCGAEPHNQWRIAIRGLSVVGWRRIPSFRRREATPLVISSSCGVTRHPGRGTAGVRGERRVVVERAHLGWNPRTVLGTVQSRAAASRTWRERRIRIHTGGPGSTHSWTTTRAGGGEGRAEKEREAAGAGATRRSSTRESGPDLPGRGSDATQCRRPRPGKLQQGSRRSRRRQYQSEVKRRRDSSKEETSETATAAVRRRSAGE